MAPDEDVCGADPLKLELPFLEVGARLLIAKPVEAGLAATPRTPVPVGAVEAHMPLSRGAILEATLALPTDEAVAIGPLMEVVAPKAAVPLIVPAQGLAGV